MKIVKKNCKALNFRTAVALGNFDGLHLGHKQLIKQMITRAEEMNLVKTVFTFDNNTLVKFKTCDKNNMLMSNEQKISMFKAMGIDLLFLSKFNENLISMSPEDFVKNILVNKLNAKLVVIGFNFRFGYKAKGDRELLKELGQKLGFEVIVIEPVMKNNKIVSSSYIRELISNGMITEANNLLGRPFTISGTVVEGKGRGRKFGFPTANLKMETNYQIPKHGVYKSRITIDEKEYLSITNIGTNPTFSDVGFSIETHIIDFSQKIYGKKVQVSLLDFVREEKKFNNNEELKRQIMKDIKNVIKCN